MEAQWITDTLTETLDHNFKKFRVCYRSKRWWSSEISESRSNFKAARSRFQRGQITLDEYKVLRNAYYGKIRKVRDKYLENWIQGDEEIHESLPADPNPEILESFRKRREEENMKCWTVLHYTKTFATQLTPSLKNETGLVVATIEGKKKMISKTLYPCLPEDRQETPDELTGTSHFSVTTKLVHKAIFDQSVQSLG